MILIPLFLLPFSAFANSKYKCEVRVTYLLKSGVVEEARVGTHARTKKECERKARTVKVHAAPTKVRKKFVAVNWKLKK